MDVLATDEFRDWYLDLTEPDADAVLLLGGSKAGNKRFYREFIPRAEAIWRDYLDDSET